VVRLGLGLSCCVVYRAGGAVCGGDGRRPRFRSVCAGGGCAGLKLFPAHLSLVQAERPMGGGCSFHSPCGWPFMDAAWEADLT
jgi:hypothetical protein